MTIFTDDLRTETPQRGVSQLQGSFGEALGASVAESLSDLPTAQLAGIAELDTARETERPVFGPYGDFVGMEPTGAKRIERSEAENRVKASGLSLKLPDGTLTDRSLDIMLTRARERRERETTIERGPDGILLSGTSLATSFLVGALDPINVASAFIPVVGELRYGKMMASAGESAFRRAGVRAGIGAAEGVVGQAALEPLDWYAHTQDGRDFGMADVLQNLAFGAALGGVIHPAGGFVGDRIRARRGEALYPFGPNDPLADVGGTRLPASVLDEAGVAEEALPENLQPPRDVVPAMQILADLPPPVHADAIRGAIANITSGEPVRAGEMLEAAAALDPRIAQSFEAWHGSPHVFDKFSIDSIGTGEGAQSFGHGLYFAENEKVARGYQRTTSDKAFIDKVSQLYDETSSPGEAWDAIEGNWKDFSPAEQRLMTALQKDDWLGFDYPHQAVSASLSRRAAERWDMSPETLEAAKALGNMYKVRINASPDHLLDWDRPIGEQSEHVRNALLNHPDPSVAGTAQKWGSVSGKDFHARLKSRADGGQADVSKILREAGIPGIKYLDSGSRGGAGDGTRNFVIFDDNHIEIIDRNGQPVPRPDPKDVPTDNPKITLPDVPEADITTKEVKAKTRRGRAAADPKTWSLTEFLADEGGLTAHPELEAIYGGKRGPMLSGFGPLIRKQGRSLEEAYRLAKENGYMFDASDVTGAQASGNFNDLLRLLTEEQSGRKQYRQDHIAETKYDPEQEAHVIRAKLESEYEATGGKASDLDPSLIARTVEILRREGETDVLNAYERAIMEVTERYDGPADLIHADPSAGAAPAAGGPVAPERGPAGLPGPADGGPAGAQPRERGGDDRQARDAAFRSLARAGDGVDAPAVLEASRAADELPDPIPSKLDERVALAEKADAEAKSLYDMMQEVFTPEEREQLNDVLNQIDREAADVADAIKRGGSCIFRSPRDGA